MYKKLVAVCHNHHPGAIGQYYERALRRDQALRDRYELVTVGPSSPARPTDVHYTGDRPLREAFDAAGAKRLPDILLYFDERPLVPLGLRDMPSVNVFMCSDWQKHFYWFTHMARLFDLTLTPWAEAENAFRRVGLPAVHTMFWAGYDPEIFRPIDLPKAHDLTFVGMIDPRMCRYRGRAMEKLISLAAEGIRINLMQGVWYEDVARAYSQSRIVFNKGWDNGFNARAIEAMACGSMLLTHEVRGTHAAMGFRDRQHLVFYRNDNEIPDLVRYFVEHETEREAIAEAGRAAVTEKFSYDTCVGTALEFIESWHSQQPSLADRISQEESAYCEAVACCYASAFEPARKLLLDSRRQDPRARNAMGVAMTELGLYDQACRELTVAAESRPGFALPLVNRATTELRAGRPAEAEKSLHKASTLLANPDFEGMDQGGLTFYTDYDAFKWDFEYAFIDNAGRDETELKHRLRKNLLCRVYETLGDLVFDRDAESCPAAVEAYRKAVSFRPDDGHLHLKIGRAYGMQKEIALAETELHKAVSMEPMFVDAQEDLYRLFREQGRVREAAQLMRDSLKLNPLFRRDRAPAYRELGDLFEQMGSLQEACAWWDACLALERDLPELRDKLERACESLTEEAMAGKTSRARPTVALAQIARNEEEFIGESLRSVQGFVDEMVVVDTGSEDDTRKIAEQCGAHVVDLPWQADFAAARNEALRHVSSDWVIMLDADEVMSSESLKTLDRYVRCGLWDAVQMVVVTYVADHRIVGFQHAEDTERSRGMPGYYLNPLIRVFRNRPDIRFEGRVHETVLGSLLRSGARIAHTGIRIDHYCHTKDSQRIQRKKEFYLRLCERNLVERPMDVKALLEAGTQLRDMNEYDRAADAFKRALKINPYFVWAVAGLLETALSGGCHYRAARSAVEQFESIRPVKMAEVDINYAMLLMHMGETEEALHRLERAVSAAPQNAVGHFVLGLLNERENDVAAAERAYNRALECAGDYTLCRARRAAMYARQQATQLLDRADTLEAVRVLRAALSRDPHNELVLNDLAVILYREGRTEESADVLRRAIDRLPWMDVICRNFIDVMETLGRKEDAERIVTEARLKMEGDGGG